MKFEIEDYGDFTVLINNDDKNCKIRFYSEQEAIYIVNLLNKYDKEVDYYNKVIHKAIKENKKQSCMLEDNEKVISSLEKEVKWLNTIVSKYQEKYNL